ncbi:heme peroxidase [Rhizoclosmatium globosum]|uniref:Heme peroxidase n=1 Tax=Rhizoclosmatium globosum TaxID=329046 RepID=A0A1Y2CIR4_9FUNG|nr:heme peroxidase [Rhizoclosmatium globosum]|eukprot:ORY46919.1 heme peroxidase [Rhizoclosmatium globosum]
MDGTGNNKQYPLWGSAGAPYLRLTPSDYGPNQSPNGKTRPNARLISNVLFGQKPFLQNSDGISDFVPAWGVMLHLDLTVLSRNSSDPYPIPVPPNDPVFNIPGSPENFIPMDRSDYTAVDNVNNLRVHPNAFTAWIDCSGLYGNSIADMNNMRSFVGGKLKSVFMEKGEFPPILPDGTFAFNIRNLNMMPQLMMNYLLFFREHNRRATVLAQRYPDWNDEQLFQRSRRWVIAIVQKITANNYITAVTGELLDPYPGYDPTVNPNIDLFFANVAFRYGHSAINQVITRIDEWGNQVREGHLLFHKAFYEKLVTQVTLYGIESILRGFATQRDQVIDTHIVSEVRNYLPLNPGHYFDLAAIGIQRARELGIPSYSKLREFFNLTKPFYWSDVTSDTSVQEILSDLYESVDDLDAYVGAFAEDKIDKNSIVSRIQRISIRDQFTRIRNGDRFWYENPGVLSPMELAELSTFTLGDMVRLNTNCTYYPNDPFITTPVSLMGTLLLSWQIRTADGYIDFRYESNATGWFGFGFGVNMLGADIYFCSNLGNGTFGVQDSWSSSTQPIPSDVSQGGINNVINPLDITSQQTYSKRVITFSRLLNTGDPFDIAITNQPMDVIFAFSDNDQLVWHGAQNRMSAKLNFYVNLNGKTALLDQGPIVSPGLKAIHGASILMTIITSNVLMAALTALVGSYGDVTFFHYKIGIAVVIAVCLTMILGYMSVKYHEEISKYGSWAERVRFIHRISGYVTYVGGLISGYFGVCDITAVLIVPVTLVAYGELILLPRARSKLRGSTDLTGLPIFTWDDINLRVGAGSKWLVIENLIYDVQKYYPSHPGGPGRILQMIGLDATNAFSGPPSRRKLASSSRSLTTKSMASFRSKSGTLNKKSQSQTQGATMVYSKGGSRLSEERNSSKQLFSEDEYGEHAHTRFAKFILAGLAIGKLRDDSERTTVTPANASVRQSMWSVTVPKGSEISTEKDMRTQQQPMLTERFTLFEFDQKFPLTDPQIKQPIYMFRFLFKTPESELVLKPGHCIMLQFVANDGKIVTRSYWPVQTVNKGGVDIIVKLIGGEMSNYLTNPYSENGTWKSLGIITDGIGLAGALHLIDYHLRNCKRDPITNKPNFQIHILTSFENENEVFGQKELGQLEASSCGALVVTMILRNSMTRTYNGLMGEITAEVVLATMPNPDFTQQWMPQEMKPGGLGVSVLAVGGGGNSSNNSGPGEGLGMFAGTTPSNVGTIFREEGLFRRKLSSGLIANDYSADPSIKATRQMSMEESGANVTSPKPSSIDTIDDVHSLAMIVCGPTNTQILVGDLLHDLGYSRVFTIHS